jgi:ketosteroid isomerase-like protein
MSNRDKRFRCISDYFEGWLTKDEAKTLDTLQDNASIMECDGRVYKGIKAIRSWFRDWNKSNSVTRWEMTDQYFDESVDVAAIQWKFSCIFAGVEYSFDGCSLISFNSGRISRILEYSMQSTHSEPYKSLQAIAS